MPHRLEQFVEAPRPVAAIRTARADAPDEQSDWMQPKGPRLDGGDSPQGARPVPPRIEAVRSGDRYVLESERRFSQSLIWSLQRHYYEARGIDAWRNAEVPYYITSNPVIAEEFAALVFAAMQDVRRRSATPGVQFILELGAGSGKFAYHFVRRLTKLCEQAEMGSDAFRYIMSDVAPANLAYWRTHPQLAPFFERGVLDTALFDVASTDRIVLESTGEIVEPGQFDSPLVTIANYVFDTTLQELFYVENGVVHECRVRLESDVDPASVEAAALLDRVTCEVEIGEPVDAPYEQPVWNEILARRARGISAGYVLFPDGTLACLDRLRKLSRSGAIVLMSDKGDHRLSGYTNVPLAHHGSASFEVDFAALAEWCAACGGLALFPKHPHRNIDVGALLLADDATTYRRLVGEFGERVGDFGPDDFFAVCLHATETTEKMDAYTVTAFLRMARYDGDLLARFLPVLVRLAPSLSRGEKQLVTEVVRACWEHYFSIGDGDLAFDIAMFFWEIESWEYAVEFFAHSARTAGLYAGTMFNAAICCGRLGNAAEEGRLLRQLLDYDPSYALAAQRLEYLAC